VARRGRRPRAARFVKGGRVARGLIIYVYA